MLCSTVVVVAKSSSLDENTKQRDRRYQGEQLWSQRLHGANPSGIANDAGLQTDTGARNGPTGMYRSRAGEIVNVLDKTVKYILHRHQKIA